MTSAKRFLAPDWPAPSHIKAYVSTRLDGVSEGEFDSLNLGGHVGDDPVHVAQNRRLFAQSIAMPDSLVWLNQVHGTVVKNLPSSCNDVTSDAAYTASKQQVCAVLTADCLPVFFCNLEGTQVAVAHAGWRGLCEGVLERTLEEFTGQEVMAWLGPAIGPDAFEVGPEVREAFVEKDPDAGQAFTQKNNGKWLGNLYLLAKQRLTKAGVAKVYGGKFCTYQDEERFYSYRRDGKTGRMASVIWIE
ncbi:peptidoglycan editing factor PgeF [Marinomonas epiphytica]